ncbi:MAG: hypothetical protein O6939_12580 [Bacteroidetes bacterium]|nr:hypothetical protein [Bacteroidota bacterium]MCZ6899371.1 hypothetical protein [Bacteroidota bacterium]
MRSFAFYRITKFVLMVIAGTLIFSAIIMYLWNWLIPELFTGPTITMIQAIGLLILAKILFGGWGRGRGSVFHSNHHRWRKRFEEKWEKMAPQEREKFRHSFRSRCMTKQEDKDTSDAGST